jgi:flagellar operon protein
LADIRLNGILSPPIDTGQPAGRSAQNDPTESFSEILGRELQGDGVKFSKHAQTRLESRNITLGGAELSKLNDAVNMAASKGVQDSLVVMNSMAFIISVPDKTVVTAMPVDEAGGNVFTNIDGAVIV